jgi:CRP/FNR family transcriptional regulator, cyclic AMP receptor protein
MGSPTPDRIMDRRQIVSILDVDSELGEAMDPKSRALAQRHALARLERLERGRWRAEDAGARHGLGLLVVDGLLLREVSLAGRHTAELLGPGDLFRPADEDAELDAVPVRTGWLVCEPARVAILDHRFTAIVGRWPELVDALFARAARRSRRLGVQLAITRVTRVDERLLIVLWHLAERWGRVRADGVHLPLSVTHDTLARLVGARRPSVTTGLGRLARLGMVERVRGGWVLHGDPQEHLARLESERGPEADEEDDHRPDARTAAPRATRPTRASATRPAPAAPRASAA